MGKPKISVTVETTQQVELTPGLRRELLQECEAWEAGNIAAKAGEAKKKDACGNVDSLMHEAGEFRALEEGIKVDRFSAKMVYPTRTAWDEKKLRKYLTPAQMEECKTTTPGTPYVKITASKGEEE